MKMYRFIITILCFFIASAPTYAQWQTPNHSTPTGRGAGVTGFGSAGPGALGAPYVGNGPNADPSFGGDTYFKTGRPWADIRAYGAVCAGGVDDTAAIQSAIDHVGTLGGGVVYFPPGQCKTTSTLIVTQPTCLVGVNAGTASGPASISAQSGDFTAISFLAGNGGSCLNNLSVFGYLNAAATLPTILVGVGIVVNMNNCTVWGGTFALQTSGGDGRIFNCYFSGWAPTGGGVLSFGSNFWYGNKIDQGVVPTAYGFFQVGGANNDGENYFFGNDFSGAYTIASFYSDDGGSGLNFSVHVASIFSSPVVLLRSKHTAIIGSTFGVNAVQNNVGTLNIVGGFAFSPVTVTGAGARSCAGNTNITC